MALITDQRCIITVVGSGYIGMSLAALLAQNDDVVVLEIKVSAANSC